MDIYDHLFDKHDNKIVDTIVAIQGAQKGYLFSRSEFIIEWNETVANTLSLFLLGLWKY